VKEGMTMQATERFDIVGKTKLWLGIALAVMVLGLAGLIVRGFNLGLDFTGGALYQFRFPSRFGLSFGLAKCRLQQFG
jgi:preprotein translocase subunit SecF